MVTCSVGAMLLNSSPPAITTENLLSVSTPVSRCCRLFSEPTTNNTSRQAAARDAGGANKSRHTPAAARSSSRNIHGRKAKTKANNPEALSSRTEKKRLSDNVSQLNIPSCLNSRLLNNFWHESSRAYIPIKRSVSSIASAEVRVKLMLMYL